MRIPFIAAAAGVFAIAASSHAAVHYITWFEIDNSAADPAADFFSGAEWSANAAGWRTYDFFVIGDAGTQINGINLGTAADPGFTPYALFTDGAIFNHGNGGNFPSSESQPPFQNLLAFDTYVAMGDTPAGDIGQVPGSIDLTDGQAGLRGTWFGSPTDPSVIDASGMLRIMRITVSADATFFSGLAEVGTPDGEIIVSIVPPAPGAASLMLLAGGVAARRRR